ALPIFLALEARLVRDEEVDRSAEENEIVRARLDDLDELGPRGPATVLHRLQSHHRSGDRQHHEQRDDRVAEHTNAQIRLLDLGGRRLCPRGEAYEALSYFAQPRAGKPLSDAIAQARRRLEDLARIQASDVVPVAHGARIVS